MHTDNQSASARSLFWRAILLTAIAGLWLILAWADWQDEGWLHWVRLSVGLWAAVATGQAWVRVAKLRRQPHD